MGKTRAEIQKAYRERKKAREGDAYREKEARRVMKYYIPSARLSKEALEARRARGREAAKRHREKHPAPSKHKIKIDFKKSIRERKQRKKMREMKVKLEKAQKAKKRLEKKIERLQKSYQRKAEASTPRSKTTSDFRHAGLSPTKVPKLLKRKLLFSNVVLKGLKEAYHKKKTDGKRVLRNVVSGKIVKKYRMMSTLTKAMGMTKKGSRKIKTSLPHVREALKKRVENFLNRDDNSRMMPGKKDCKKVGKDKSTVREKFMSENSDVKISLSHFASFRPANVKLASFLSRNTCLCTKHQNFALKLKSLKDKGCIQSTNPDNFLHAFPDEEKVDLLLANLPKDGKVKFEQWKRMEVDGKNKMKIVTLEVETQVFCETFRKEVADFRQHCFRADEQYNQLKSLKQNLPPNHVIVQMDFAENYKVKYRGEVQSAYWNCDLVTLHPVVVYHRDENGELRHESRCIVSDELGHNPFTVFSILKKVVSHLKDKHPNLQYVHYWTDSPSSQYRNKTLFSVVSDHETLFGMKASWNYFEAGHGKGPCDGVGGTVKRMADDAVKQGDAQIQDAHDFFKWASVQDKSVIKYDFVSKLECKDSEDFLRKKYAKVKTIKGTMAFHSVVGLPGGKIMSAKTSCYCTNCFGEGGFQPETCCKGKWETHGISHSR
ncbi:uncharacterized protein LOC118421089 [Branchiostoma floridae]|uniref:Uncharacterized protein LOC118421089 n=1 Tax=Branchiostoma floridae TaxID=7739 RepID=A0A9J7MZ37_BRAFL|nr:uncharacterized protein LOC118421089 [Branchiostoma floridae]